MTNPASAPLLSATISPSENREGLDIAFPDATGSVVVTDVWSVGGWTLQFAKIAAGLALDLNQSAGNVYVKTITGGLSNIDQGPFTAPKQVRDTLVQEAAIEAGPDGAIVAVMIETPTATSIHSMDDLKVSGTNAELLAWCRFDESALAKGVDYFKGLDAHLLPGFHLLDEAGEELIYVHFWTAGKGVDLSAHNHAQPPSEKFPAFAETHWVFANGTGNGGMYDCDPNDRDIRRSIPMQTGQDHGPFWTVDTSSGLPKMRENGAIEYGYHGWKAGTNDEEGQVYDLVAAFELNPAYAKI